MSTVIRPEVSARNNYWIDRHRYYELKHFCLQYPIWRERLRDLDGYSVNTAMSRTRENGRISDPTERTVELRELYTRHIDMVERTAWAANTELGKYILTAVTRGETYEHLRLRCGVPCSRGTFYDTYRLFFWLLDRARK